jgi:hypothetical protein
MAKVLAKYLTTPKRKYTNDLSYTPTAEDLNAAIEAVLNEVRKGIKDLLIIRLHILYFDFYLPRLFHACMI